MKDPIELNKKSGKYQYCYNGRNSPGHDTKQQAARAYIKELTTKEPKYISLFKDKPWSEIYKMTGIKL